MERLKERKPATEAGFFALADRVRRRRREQFAAMAGDNRKKTMGGSGSFMGHDLWERVARAV